MKVSPLWLAVWTFLIALEAAASVSPEWTFSRCGKYEVFGFYSCDKSLCRLLIHPRTLSEIQIDMGSPLRFSANDGSWLKGRVSVYRFLGRLTILPEQEPFQVIAPKLSGNQSVKLLQEVHCQ